MLQFSKIKNYMVKQLYQLDGGCQWRALPKDFPQRTTVFEYLELWECDRTLERVRHGLYAAVREQADREASPTEAIIDSHSVKGAEKGGAKIDPPDYGAGKKIKGKKHHIAVDTLGPLLNLIVHPADIQDHNGGLLILHCLMNRC